MKPNPPLILGHRGCSGEAPENTMAAFQLALDQGADGIELDIFLSKDGHLVVTHDESLLRLTGLDRQTRELTLSELRRLDFGNGEKIPTLDQVLETFGPTFELINIEIKSTGWFSDGIETKLVHLIESLGLQQKILISSFNPLHLLRLKQLRPHWRKGQLIDFSNPLTSWTIWGNLIGAETINLNQADATPARQAGFMARRHNLIFWTVNDEQRFAELMSWRPYAIITNYPKRLLEFRRTL